MTLDELKNKQVSVEERANKVVESLGLNGNERSVVAGLNKGDKFSLASMTKVELQDNGQSNNNNNFVPITFTTNTGASIGAKHFAGVEIDDDAPAIGSTPIENAKFLVWCIDHNVIFVVKKKTSEEVPATENRRAYNKNTYVLEVEDYDAE
jgi:hypothetical protein